MKNNNNLCYISISEHIQDQSNKEIIKTKLNTRNLTI
jgi:hypothetical protein